MFGDLLDPQWPTEKRGALVWHRRAGKDSTSANLIAMASQMRIGTYWHLLPTLNQGRKVVWDRIDSNGVRLLDQAFPEEMRDNVNNTEMSIKFKNGSVYQIVGSDNFDSLIGANPLGVIFSEWAVSDPRSWDFIRPILTENSGFALFIYTPRGKNHGHTTYELAKVNPRWFTQLLTINSTERSPGVPVISKEAIEEERASGMPEEMIQQEYYCSFDTGQMGAYYTNELVRMRSQDRIGDFPWIVDEQAISIWDIGIRDDNAILIAQPDGEYCRIIDCLSGSGRSMASWIKDVKEMPYIYHRHFAPHDIEVRDYTTGIERIEMARNLGIDFDIAPNISLQDGIDAGRVFMSRVRINEQQCGPLIAALENYRREYDPRLKVFRKNPLHDWSSHLADAYRYLALSWDLVHWNYRSPSDYEIKSKVIKSVGKRNINGRFPRNAFANKTLKGRFR
jgi:hypothetical protein